MRQHHLAPYFSDSVIKWFCEWLNFLLRLQFAVFSFEFTLRAEVSSIFLEEDRRDLCSQGNLNFAFAWIYKSCICFELKSCFVRHNKASQKEYWL